MKKIIIFLFLTCTPIFGAGVKQIDEGELLELLGLDNIGAFKPLYEKIVKNPNYKIGKSSLLHLAEGPKIARFLLEKGADIESLGSDNNTPLIEAVTHAAVDVVKFLAENGAKLDAKNRFGRTALAEADKRLQTSLASLKRAKDDGDESDIQFAQQKKDALEQIVEFLKKHMSAVSSLPAAPGGPKSQPEQKVQKGQTSETFWNKIQAILKKYSEKSVPAGKTIWDLWSQEDWDVREKEITAGDAPVWRNDPKLGELIKDYYMQEYHSTNNRPELVRLVGNIVPPLFFKFNTLTQSQRNEIMANIAHLEPISKILYDYLLGILISKTESNPRAAAS